MSTARSQLLPFDQLDDKQFESFLLQFLGAGISLEVIERLPVTELAEPDLVKPSYSTARYRIIRAIPPAGFGQKQHGVDIVAYTESGAQWVFQCKNWPKKKFDVAAATEVMRKAQTEYPEASRYFVALSHPATKPVEVRRIVEADPKWQLWEPSEIWTRFRNEVPNEKQIDLVRRFFDEDIVKQLYPLQHDSLLLSAGDFFARSSPINFSTTFVGREAELAQLLAFARASGPAAAILSAPGGIGKTRLLREFAERLAAESPDLRVLFLNPDASAQANTDGLRAAQEGKLVVVLDDAHRSETLRKDIARSVSAKKGRLLLAARPQSVEALRVWSADHGFTANEPIRLPPLDDALLQRIAATELGAELAHHAGRIVALADHNALLVTVAAELLKQEPQSSIDTLLASENFGRRILDRLANKTLESAFPDYDRRERARDVMHVLAILAPWTKEVLPLDQIASLLDLRGREFDQVCGALLAAKLVVRTGRGLRVVPDLLADHLVRQACFEPGPERRLTLLAEAIQKSFAPTISCTTGLHVIRNLAEAEAQQGDAEGKLVEPFWSELRKQYVGATAQQRHQLLSVWGTFSIYLPGFTIELARLELDTGAPPQAAQRDEIAQLLGVTIEPPANLPLLARLITPVAIHQPKVRRTALDILFELFRADSACDERNPSGPLGAFAAIATFADHHRLDTINELLGWLDEILRTTEGERLFLRARSPALTVILKPLFDCAIEHHTWSSNTVTWGVQPLAPDQVATVRTDTLALIERQVLPAGEIATLNILPVLAEGIRAPRPKWAKPPSQEWSEAWLPLRRKALGVISKLLADPISPRVRFRAREMLLELVAYATPDPLAPELNLILSTTPHSPDLGLSITLLSNRWNEFVRPLSLEETHGHNKWDLCREEWEHLTNEVARRLIEHLATPAALLVELTRIQLEYSNAGEHPEPTELFAALARVAPKLASSTLALALTTAATPMDRSLLALIPSSDPLEQATRNSYIRTILESNNPTRWSALFFWLRDTAKNPPDDECISLVSAWARKIEDSALEPLRPILSWATGKLTPLIDAIFVNLRLDRFAPDALAVLCASLGHRALVAPDQSLPAAFVTNLLVELHRLDRLDIERSSSLLPSLERQAPLAFFSLLIRRIRAAERSETAPSFSPLPFDDLLLGHLPTIPGYPHLARALMDDVHQATPSTRYAWTTLFQWAVLRVSPLGLTLLGEWLNDTRDADDLGRLIRCLRFNGSTIVIEQPHFVRSILARIRTIAPTRSEDLRALLASTGSPTSWGLTNGEPNPETRRYRVQAAKAAAVHAADPDLAAFYRIIVEREDAHAAFLLRPYLDDEWSYE